MQQTSSCNNHTTNTDALHQCAGAVKKIYGLYLSDLILTFLQPGPERGGSESDEAEFDVAIVGFLSKQESHASLNSGKYLM